MVLAGLVVASGGAGGCSRQGPGAEAGAPREFRIRGVVRAIDPAAMQVTVEHEDVPGLMPAMTMPFQVRDWAGLEGVPVGAAVRFRFQLTENASWAEGFERIDPSVLKLPPGAPPSGATGAVRLKEGDRLDGFDLVDQAGRPVTRATFGDRLLLVSFIFVRCPVPEYCPLISRQMAVLEGRIAADPALAGRVGMLSISFDPQDTPPVLAEYGARFARDLDTWRFVTGAPEELARLTRAFSVHVKPEAGTLSHGLSTALIEPDGTIRKLWRGNGWSPDEVLAALGGSAAPAVAEARTP